jgi:hypothetical protein
MPIFDISYTKPLGVRLWLASSDAEKSELRVFYAMLMG